MKSSRSQNLPLIFLILAIVSLRNPLAFSFSEGSLSIKQGVLKIFVHEDSESEKSFKDYFLEDKAGKTFPLVSKSKSFLALKSGIPIQVFGKSIGKSFNVIRWERLPKISTAKSITTHLESSEISGQPALVIPINLNNSPLVYCDQKNLEAIAFSGIDSVANFYRKVSRNAVQLSGQVLPPIEIDFPNGECLFYEWAAAADQQLKIKYGTGILDGVKRKIYVLPRCGGSNLGEFGSVKQGVTLAWVHDYCDSSTPSDMAHELGHNFGLSHSATAEYEYGDETDVMGSGVLPQFNAPHLRQMSWLPKERFIRAKISGSYSIGTIDDSGEADGSRPLVLIIKKKKKQYFISYRRKLDLGDTLDIKHADKISIHAWVNSENDTTLLLKELGANDSYTHESGFRISVLSVGASTADLFISLDGSISKPPEPIGPLSLTASPNPCSIGVGKGSCKATISWNTGTGKSGCLVLRATGQTFACGVSGKADADWIGTNPIVFDLKDGNASSDKILTSITVTGVRQFSEDPPPDFKPTIYATPQSCKILPGSGTCSSQIVFSSSKLSCVFIKETGQTFACGTIGNPSANWIGTGQITFELRAGTKITDPLLGSTVVQGTRN